MKIPPVTPHIATSILPNQIKASEIADLKDLKESGHWSVDKHESMVIDLIEQISLPSLFENPIPSKNINKVNPEVESCEKEILNEKLTENNSNAHGKQQTQH